MLTARGVSRTRPLTRVLFDRRLRIPPRARIWSTLDDGPILLVTTDEAVRERPDAATALEAAGAELVRTAGHDLADAFNELGRRELRWVVVEGGPTFHRACWSAGLVDHVQVYVTPGVLGPAGPALPLGPDVLVHGHVYRTH